MEAAPGFASPEQIVGAKNLALPPCGLRLLPAEEGRMVCGAPKMNSCFSADGGLGEGHPEQA